MQPTTAPALLVSVVMIETVDFVKVACIEDVLFGLDDVSPVLVGCLDAERVLLVPVSKVLDE